MSDPVIDFSDMLRQISNKPKIDWKQAIVTASMVTTVKVKFSLAEPEIAAEIPFIGRKPSAGETVWLLKKGGSYLCLGVVGKNIVDSGWVTSTLSTGWNSLSSVWTVKYILINGVVYLNGLAQWSSGTNTTIFTLPIWARPKDKKLFGCPNSAMNNIRVDVALDGTVIVTGYAGTYISLNNVIFPIS